jgi:hypothetical protein
MEIFLSHSTQDHPIAEALHGLLEQVFGTARVRVLYSSDQRPSGGIAPGEEWLRWITRHIEQSDKTYVLLTPESMNQPWVLWESGAAAGVALAKSKRNPVVPITFGIRAPQAPSPFHATQIVQGDTKDGLKRLLHDINNHLDQQRVESGPLETKINRCVPRFLTKIRTVLTEPQTAEPQTSEALLESIPNLFSASNLAGSWVTCFTLGKRLHADIAQVIPESDRGVKIRNDKLTPRADWRSPAFSYIIEAELVDRHLVGHWRNLNYIRYFGSIHLAVLSGGEIMNGYYTSFTSDIKVDTGRWRWVRLDPNSLSDVDLSSARLREPGTIHALLTRHSRSGQPLPWSDVVEAS